MTGSRQPISTFLGVAIRPEMNGGSWRSIRGTDVRAAAALVVAGLGAAGEMVLDGLEHLDRGYDRMAEKLVSCGAHLCRSAS